MTHERKEGQMSFGDDLGVELVTDLGTGKQTLRRRRARKPSGQTKAPAPTKQWWDIVGFMAFNNAAEGWRQSQSVIIAEESGYNVEFVGPQIREAETEESLRKAFLVAKRSRITAPDIVRMMKGESLNIEERLGTGANWVPAFVDSAIDLLVEVYRLNLPNTEALKQIAHQRQLPQFN